MNTVSGIEISVTENGIRPADSESLYSIVSAGARQDPHGLLLGYPDGTVLTRAEVDTRVRAVASALAERGVRHGDRVAVLGRTSMEWALLDCAVLALGAVVVPVYPTSSPSQIEHILADSGSTGFAAETEDDAARLLAAGAGAVWTFPQISGWAQDTTGTDPDEPIAEVRADDLAMIVYTSGTTGLSKGCMITHRNMYAAAANTVRQTGTMFNGSTVLALPLSHVFGQTILFACLFGGSETYLLPGIPDLIPALTRLRPTFLTLIPYGLEKIRKHCRALLAEGAEREAVTRGLELLRRRDPVVPVEPVAGALGGRLRYVISGGASLDDTTAGFYAGVGVVILNCYGLTEAATAVTVSAPETNRLNTVGRPIPGTEVGIAAEDGEVLVRGPHVTPGYWGAAREQRPVDADGWLHTGDIGELDDGYLRITGRKKEILVTSGGKNVAPTPLEDRVRLHPLVSNCMVLGDGRAYVTALVTLDAERAEQWRAENPDSDPATAVQVAVDEANELVSRAESIRAFRIVAGDFTIANGLLTPSLKLRRAAIAEAYADDIQQLYVARE